MLRSDAAKYAKELVTGVGISNFNISTEGLPAGNQFTIRFNEEPELASRHVRKVLVAQKLGGGKYAQHFVKADINPDKNTKTIRTEILLKKLLTRAKELHPPAKLTGSKEEGMVLAGCKPLVRLDVESMSCTALDWNPDIVAKHNIDRETLDKFFTEEAGGGGSSIQWSRS